MYLQCALLYTTTNGARLVRISTLALPVSDQMGAVFKGADLDSQLAALTRQVGLASVFIVDPPCYGLASVSLYCMQLVGWYVCIEHVAPAFELTAVRVFCLT